MLVRDGDSSLELQITSYELPAGEGRPGSDDQNWLVLRCTWLDGEGNLRKDSNSCLLTYELQELTGGLKVLNAGIKDAYHSDFAEPWFTLDAQPEGEGFQVDVSFVLPNTMDGDDTAELSCLLSRDEMKDLIQELDRACAKFPERI